MAGQISKRCSDGRALTDDAVNGDVCHLDAYATLERFQILHSRKRHREEVLLRAQTLYEKKRRELEEREQMASNLKQAAIRSKLEEIWKRNRATEERTKEAKLIQESEQQRREKKLQEILHRLDEVLHRRRNLVAFDRLRTAQRILTCSQRARVNRSLIARRKESIQRLQREQEEARQRSIENEIIMREIKQQRLRLLHDKRALRCFQHQRQQELLRWERGVKRQRRREEQLYRHMMQRKRLSSV